MGANMENYCDIIFLLVKSQKKISKHNSKNNVTNRLIKKAAIDPIIQNGDDYVQVSLDWRKYMKFLKIIMQRFFQKKKEVF